MARVSVTLEVPIDTLPGEYEMDAALNGPIDPRSHELKALWKEAMPVIAELWARDYEHFQARTAMARLVGWLVGVMASVAAATDLFVSVPILMLWLCWASPGRESRGRSQCTHTAASFPPHADCGRCYTKHALLYM